jgi:pimeloyl-ACP methyl ester carboxylesterase
VTGRETRFGTLEDAEDPGGPTISLAATEWGSPEDPPVVFVHGGGQTRHSWGSTAERIAERGWHTITLDQRGHGDSDRSPAQHYGVRDFAQDLVAVSGALTKPPVVVGASLGGLAALLAEGEIAPGTMSALVLVDITPRQERTGVERIVGFMLRHATHGFANLDEAADAVADYQPHRARPRSHDGLRKNLRQHEDGRWRWHWDPALFSGHRNVGSAISATSFTEAASHLSLPTLLVRGKLSDLVSEETAREFLELVPHASFVDVSNAGHMVAGDNNDRFAEAVMTFLEASKAAPDAQP